VTKTGLQFDATEFRRKIERMKREVNAEKFLPDLKKYTTVVLNACVKTTPARDLSLIRKAQTKQYANRINYIPSVHSLVDPTLITTPQGSFMYSGGKWYRPDLWTLSGDLYGVYQTLLAEQLRRMETEQSEFIAARAQARFLYKLSWVQVGQSIGLTIRATSPVLNSVTRRVPPKNPPRGYAQVRGRKYVISIVIYNPFINDDSRYREFDGAEILDDALQAFRPAFNTAIKKHLQHILYAVMRSQ
jgi:hypothetical protein